MNFAEGDMVLYTTPGGQFTLTGIVSWVNADDFRVDFPSIGRWYQTNIHHMSDDMKKRLLIVDDDAVFGSDGVRRNY